MEVLNSPITTPKTIHCTAAMLALRTVGFYKYDMCVASDVVETCSFLQNFIIMVPWSNPF